MSTTDTKAAFEALPENGKLNLSKVPDGSEYISFCTQLAWRNYQAATEAAKATEPKLSVDLPDGDNRKVTVVWHEVKDGVRYVCITVDDAKATGTAGEHSHQGNRYGNLTDAEYIEMTRQEAARQPAPVVAGCEFCGNAIGHDLDCQNHPVNAKAPFQQDDEHKAFLATYLDAARKASDNTSAEMILWHANRHWNGKAGEMWRARAALEATAALVATPKGVTIKAFQAAHDKAWHITIKHPFGESFVRMSNQRDIQLAELIAATNRSQP